MSSQFPTNFFECQLVLNIIEPLRVSLLEAIEVDSYACRVMGKMIEESKEKVKLIDVVLVCTLSDITSAKSKCAPFYDE